jgi:hypothetical protein
MPRKPSARVVLNRQALSQVRLALADGALEVGELIIRSARPPDRTPYGEGLVTRGGWLAYVGDKKVGGGGLDGRQPKKPRAVRVRGTQQIQVIAGFGFPGKFQELGTINHPGQPFLTPSMQANVGRAAQTMERVVRPKLRAMK